jgi:hypothetical protein
MAHLLVVEKKIRLERHHASGPGYGGQTLEKSRAYPVALVRVGHCEGSFRPAGHLGARKILTDRDEVMIELGEQRHRPLAIESTHHIVDDIVDAGLSEEPKVAALRRELPVELAKRVAIGGMG